MVAFLEKKSGEQSDRVGWHGRTCVCFWVQRGGEAIEFEVGDGQVRVVVKVIVQLILKVLKGAASGRTGAKRNREYLGFHGYGCVP